MVSPVLIIWAFLSVLVSGLTTYAFVQPVWLVGSNLLDTFGMISLCLSRTVFPGGNLKQECEFYGGYFNLGNLPSGAWQAACVLYGAGCVLLSCGAFLAVCTSCIPCDVVRTVTVMAGYVQFVAVLVMIAALFIYPLGFGSSFIRQYCGSKSVMYQAYDCSIGWSFVLAVTGTCLAMFCPVLSRFTDMKSRDIMP
ncbi:LHFPL tetraspan subfamily member 2a protein-like [Mytilus edulis]|uniref:LHFPL tetraspan subfamily member 2a protein-like n=1 Tax=Mytilus edulis TaxID=6550 RepID=UPI0039F12D04